MKLVKTTWGRPAVWQMITPAVEAETKEINVQVRISVRKTWTAINFYAEGDPQPIAGAYGGNEQYWGFANPPANKVLDKGFTSLDDALQYVISNSGITN